MNENRTDRPSNRWKWAALAAGVLAILMLTCAISMVWGGLLGFALGRATAPRQSFIEPYPFDPFESDPFEAPRPFPGLPPSPYDEGRPWLGVYYEMQDDGALITGVITGSPADQAGLQEGDVISEVDGSSVGDIRTLGDVIQQYSPGDDIELTILRNGRERIFSVRLASRMDLPIPIEPAPGG